MITTSAPPHQAAITMRNVVKTYGTGDAAVTALDGVSLDFPRGRFTAIMGPSGSGKSTLMHCAAGLDSVSAGTVHLGDTELTALTDKQLTRLRRERVGFVFQSFNLLPTLTAAHNIRLPLDLAGRGVDREWYAHLVHVLGLGDRLDHTPGQLSGGQRQRVACARALVTRPDVVFADEPTGNLDSRTSHEVLDFLRRSVDELNQTIVMVTHDPAAAGYADRVLVFDDGRVAGELIEPTAQMVLDSLKQVRA
ncbi:ABC transporter ATP-binding protein [Streptomyces sp. NBC_00878]|uniref:ABC transporter ATP-binding protein n=1 Tax=Streptomyces sp. NBC_00878 TaxID=2975854 RepID=UPI002255A09F|nr:ABC transporter ATP-binding protein [Streptomyces sp. NBC_00878]MCX4908271.1 ABC transporter ATP-binding protein [Streptomyces sp. NBC_00878]